LDNGKDIPIPRKIRRENQEKIRILIAFAPKVKRGEPKLNIGWGKVIYLILAAIIIGLLVTAYSKIFPSLNA